MNVLFSGRRRDREFPLHSCFRTLRTAGLWFPIHWKLEVEPCPGLTQSWDSCSVLSMSFRFKEHFLCPPGYGEGGRKKYYSSSEQFSIFDEALIGIRPD